MPDYICKLPPEQIPQEHLKTTHPPTNKQDTPPPTPSEQALDSLGFPAVSHKTKHKASKEQVAI